MSYNIIKQSLIPIGLSTLLFSSPAVANLVTALNGFKSLFNQSYQAFWRLWGLSSNHVKSAVKDVEIAVPVEPS